MLNLLAADEKKGQVAAGKTENRYAIAFTVQKAKRCFETTSSRIM